MAEIQELSFQNVVDTILKPAGVTVGGYPDELFIDMAEDEREQWQCNICYLVLRTAQQCDNKHLFCASCVFAWSMTYGANSDKCPVCRHKQSEYIKNPMLDDIIGRKRVKCLELGCSFKAPLHYYLKHSHGMKLYCNDVDLNSLRQTRPAPVNPINAGGILFLPSLRSNTGSNVREGRNLLQDMMLVLHLEMELRRRAIERFATEQNETERVRHMSEVLAIQEQMQEITGFLNVLFSIPPNVGSMQPRLSTRFAESTRLAANDDDDSDSSDSSDSSGVVSNYRRSERERLLQRSSRITGSRNPPDRSTSLNQSTINHNLTSVVSQSAAPIINPTPPTSNRTMRRTEIRQGLQQSLSGEARGLSSHPQSRTTELATQQSDSTNRNLIDINNNQQLSRNQSRPIGQTNHIVSSSRNSNPGLPNEERDSQLINERIEQSRPSSSRTSGLPTVQRPSSTFRNVLEQLPPISSPRNPTQSSQEAQNENSNSIQSTSTTNESSTEGQAVVTSSSSRRPAPPPASSGPTINTRRHVRHNTTNNTSSQHQGIPLVRSRVRARGTSDPVVLPSTPGQLLRSRRRSEIRQQIRSNMDNNNNENPENGS